MIYTKHAKQQMAVRGITLADADEVLVNPMRVEPGDDGALNFWGYGPSGYRVRVPVAPDGVHIKTVAWADYRKRGR